LAVEPADIQTNYLRHQGDEAITLAVSAQDGVNIVDVGQRVRQKIELILSKLPTGIELDAIYDQAKIVDESVDGFILNLVMSVIVVVLTLWLFMGWRSALVVGATLIVTVMGTVLIMWLMDLRLQRISLGAMVIAMGMLVDNAIVVAEGMMMQMKQGAKPQPAASFIVKRTQWPLLGATVIGIAAFSGIGLSDDATGEFLYSLFAVVLISLTLSWVMAITLVPTLGKLVFKTTESSNKPDDGSRFQQGFIALLTGFLRHRWLTLAALLSITVVAFMSFGFVKQGFFPPSNAPLFYIHYWGQQNEDIRSTERIMKQAEKAVLSEEGVKSVTSFIGRGADRFTLTFAPEPANESYAMMLVRAEDKDDIDNIISDMKKVLPAVNPDASFYFQRVQFGPGSGAKIGIRFSGDNAQVLRELADKSIAILEADAHIQDVRHNWRELGLSLNTQFDEISAGIAGVSRADFRDTIEYASTGLQLGKLYDEDYAYPIRAKMADAQQDPLDAIRNSQVWSSQQSRYVPFRQVSKGIELQSEEVQIHRRDRVPTITIWAEPGNEETAADALARIWQPIQDIELPDGFKLEWGGEYESSADAQQALGKGLPAGFLVMFIISVLLFGRARQPLIIWAIVPMATVGVVAGLLLTDMPFGFMSLLGFLSLFGMLIKNAIVLLEEIDLQIEEGKAVKDAILEASASRLRPVTLAAITTILGMAPLLTDAFFADMSVTIMGGLAFATLLTLIAVPVLYSLLFKVSFRNKPTT
jgi:multidrug efflux pump subunit AcrB